MSNKSQVYSNFQKLKAYINTQFQREIKTIQCDNGVNTSIITFETCVILMECRFVCLALIHHLKMANPNKKYAPLIILFKLY